MSKRVISRVVLVMGALFFMNSCKAGAKKAPPIGEEWYRYISACTSGTISRKAEVRVLFVNNVGDMSKSTADLAGLFSFKPDVKGQAKWRDSRELVFVPDQELRPGTDYQARLQVGRILKLPKSLSHFPFTFHVIQPNLEIDIDGLTPQDETSPSLTMLRGSLVTADSESNPAVEKALTAFQEGQQLTIEWQHQPDGQHHTFLAKGIVRKTADSQMVLKWDGQTIRAANRGERTIPVPAQGEFRLLEAEVALAGDQRHILLRFSDPLKKSQNLDGLVRVANHDLTFDIEANLIRVYSRQGFENSVDVTVERGIRNFWDAKLKSPLARTLTFESIKPAVRFLGKGVILPQKEKLTVPFEAVNLRSVQVTAFQIFSSNLAQFFQLNSLEGSEELTRVGRFLWRKTIPLTSGQQESSQWRRYDLDVTPLFKENPGSLFRIILSFNRGNSTYPCPAVNGRPPVALETPFANQDDVNKEDASNWDYWQNQEDEEGRNWENRNDPCQDAYYNPSFNEQVVQARNFIASNIGLIAKTDESRDLRVVATDIRTARPAAGVRIKVFNFQNQLLAEAKSDNDGFAILHANGKPFYLVAQSGDDVGYLRVSKDAALPMSHFDVGGEKVQRGVKGFLYGERGVWRPGDPLNLTFVLFDRDRTLPPNHPVIMELYNPKGQLIKTCRPDKSVDAFHYFKIVTDESAPTGNWKARVLVGGLEFEKNLKIETVTPNRLKIDFDLGKKVLSSKEMPVQAAVASQWLHGAPAANLKCDVTANLNVRTTRFARYQDYVFDDPTREFTGGEQDVFEGDLDEGGKASFPVNLEVGQPSPGMLDVSFFTRVFEESGNFSSDTLTIPFHPFSEYVGLKTPKGDETRGMLLTDQDHDVDIATVDAAGNPVSRDRIEVALYKISWKWWWDKSGESLAQFASNQYTHKLQSGTVATRDGAGKWKFQVKYPEWGRYLVRACDPVSGHCSAKIIYIDWPGWAGRAREEKGVGATRLNFTADKEKYQVGEKAVIFLPETAQGRALVSLENGSAVLQQQWVETREGQNKFDIALTEQMSPNVYVCVTLLQPHQDKKSDTPIRLYGAIPLLVENPRTRLSPQLRTADEFKPNQDIAVEISEKEGRAMTYTLAVVDEGLLGLTRYRTPDLRQEFYQREALGVRTWDLFDDVVEAYGDQLSRILALGGDEGGEAKGAERKPRRFPPLSMFAGPFRLEARRTQTQVLRLPLYFGAVRVMVVAGSGGAFGMDEKSVPVRQDLMILPTLPRVARPNEEFALPVSVFVTKEGLKEVQLTVETDDLFQIVGGNRKTVSFSRPGDQIVFFNLKTASYTGPGKVRLLAKGGGQKIDQTTNIQVLSANPRTIQMEKTEIEAGQSWEKKIVPFGIKNSNEVLVEVSAIPPLNLERRLDYLIHYPHGCLEQTVSTAFPQLFLGNLVQLDPEQKKQVTRNVQAAIEKMATFQAPEGGFYFWPGGQPIDSWATNYAAHFLLEAGRQGYYVPAPLLDKWKAYQKNKANSWTTGDADQKLTQAFRLFTLALAGDPDLGAMNRLRESEDLECVVALQLAAAFNLAGLGDAAEDLLRKSDWKLTSYREDARTYGSQFRDQAILVRTLVQLGKTDKAQKILLELTRLLATDRWLSTQETAYALMAIGEFYGRNKAAPFRFQLGWDNEKPQDVEITTPICRQLYTAFPDQGRTIRIVNPAGHKIFVSLFKIGVPAAGVETEASANLKISVNYTDRDNNAVSPESMQQGVDVVAEIKIANLSGRDLHNLALTHMVPAGCQIINPRLESEASSSGHADYQDIRDDRILTYFGLKAGGEKAFKVVLNASFGGKFYLPGIMVEAMYDASVHANTKGKWVEIVQ